MTEEDYDKLDEEQLRAQIEIIERVLDRKIAATGRWRGGQRECENTYDDGKCGCKASDSDCYLMYGGYGR